MSEERKIRWKTLRIQGLRQRWVFNSIMPVLLMLVLLVTLFSVGISSYYYGTMQDGLMKQARAEAGAFNDYFMDNGFAEYLQRATQSTTNFEDKDRIELQFINGAGRIQVSSTSSLKNGIKPGTPDIEQAIAQQDCVAFQGRDPETGENILAVSAPLMYSGKVVGVLRLVTSLREVNRQILVTIAVVLVIAALCMTMVILANLLFINDVVEPVAVVTDAAKRISAGGYGIQIENRYSDELGELVDNINDMSLKIGRNEKMKSEFISSVSHELRTPLTAIKGWAETLADMGGEVDPEMLAKGMRVITSETERLAGMVEELLDFSRIQSGRMKLVKDRMDVIAELSEAVLMFEERARHEGKRLIYNEPDQFASFMGDRNRLRQVFVNIIDNALKYSDRGDTVTVRASVSESQVDISVADTGIGIREEDLPKIKEKFFKANSTRRGSGIGLAVADEIVSLHGGTLDITSKENVGTRVTIHLPLGNG